MGRWIVCSFVLFAVMFISWEETAAYPVEGKDTADVDPKEHNPIVFVDPIPEELKPSNAESTAKPDTSDIPLTTEISREETTEGEKKPIDIAPFFIISGRH